LLDSLNILDRIDKSINKGALLSKLSNIILLGVFSLNSFVLPVIAHANLDSSGNWINCNGSIDNDTAHHTTNINDLDPTHHLGIVCNGTKEAWTPGLATQSPPALSPAQTTTSPITVPNQIPSTVSFQAIVDPSAFVAGKLVTIANNINYPLVNGIIDFEFYDQQNQKVYQQIFEHQNISLNQPGVYSVGWTPTQAGTYVEKLGLFTDGWSRLLDWQNNFLILNITPTPTITSVNNPANPFAGTKLFINPNSQPKQWVDSHKLSDPVNASLMEKIANQAETSWLGDWNSNISSDVGNFMAQTTSQGAMPVFAVYNVPFRDCGNYSAGGVTNTQAYQNWITSIADAIGNGKAAIILEPDGLSLIDCLSAQQKTDRFNMIKNAVTTLKAKSNIAVYIDAGHPNWISAGEMANRLKQSGIDQADGFALNVSNFTTTSDNANYGQQISSILGGKHFVIDTARNGLGSAPDNQWCNPPGRVLGSPPTTNTGNSLIDAYLWLKAPGESDGSCNGGPSAGTFWPEYALGLAQRANW